MRPAINVGLSVSRVGGSAQTKIMKKVSGTLKLDLATFRELQAFVQFSSDLDKETLKVIEKGKRMVELLKQKEANPIPFEKQAVIIYIGTKGYLEDIVIDQVKKFEKEVFDKLESSYKYLAEKIREERTLTDEIEEAMKKLAIEVHAMFK